MTWGWRPARGPVCSQERPQLSAGKKDNPSFLDQFPVPTAGPLCRISMRAELVLCTLETQVRPSPHDAQRPPGATSQAWSQQLGTPGRSPRNRKNLQVFQQRPIPSLHKGWLPYTVFLYLANYPPPANMIECVHTALCSRYTRVGGCLHTCVCVHVWDHMYMGMCSSSLHWNCAED